MPNYLFDCAKCNEEKRLTMAMSEYMNKKDSGFYCDCGNKLNQRFGFLSSNIKRSSEEIMNEIKEEARSIVKKIDEGNVQTVREIYGEDLNKQKENYTQPAALNGSFKRTG